MSGFSRIMSTVYEIDPEGDDIQIPNTGEKLSTVGSEPGAIGQPGNKSPETPNVDPEDEDDLIQLGNKSPENPNVDPEEPPMSLFGAVNPAPKKASSTKKRRSDGSDGPEFSAKRQRTTTGTKSRKAPLTAAQQSREDSDKSNEPSEKPTKPDQNESAQDKTLREITRLQHGTEPLIARAPFMRLVQEIFRDKLKGEYRIQLAALASLQEIGEAVLTERFALYTLASIHAGRVTIMKKDIDHVNRMRPLNYVPMGGR